jgi:hypothetical protein
MSARAHGPTLSVAATAALFVACSASNPPASPSDALAQAFCTRSNACYPTDIQHLFGDLATCVARTKVLYSASLALPGLASDASAKARACADSINQGSCASLIATGGCPFSPGAFLAGMPCEDDNQCQSSLCQPAAGASPSLCGTCAPVPAASGACTTSRDCPRSMNCAESKCIVLGSEGATCDATHFCDTGFFCADASGINSTLDGTCKALLVAGATCNPKVALCNGLAGLGCDPTSNTCKPISMLPIGSDCSAADQLDLCAKSTCFGGKCTAYLADGAACGAMGSQGTCTPPAACDRGTCRLPGTATCP